MIGGAYLLFRPIFPNIYLGCFTRMFGDLCCLVGIFILICGLIAFIGGLKGKKIGSVICLIVGFITTVGLYIPIGVNDKGVLTNFLTIAINSYFTFDFFIGENN